MKEKIKNYIKTKKEEFKRLKRKIKLLEDKLIDVNNVVLEQSKNIDYLLDQQKEYKEKAIEMQREIRELKSKNKQLLERDNKLQQIEATFELVSINDINLKKLSKIVKGK